MLKRLIEVALPLQDISEQSSNEKYVQEGNVTTLHIWWARRPVTACRAVIFCSLVPDPDDDACPDAFRRLVKQLLGGAQYRPRGDDGNPVADTARNRCLEFVKHLVQWNNSADPAYIEPARKLVEGAHQLFAGSDTSEPTRVLDPFAGGGAIPIEALRLGCTAHAIDLNPVAHLLERCLLVYAPQFGRANSRPVPAYIKQLGRTKSHALFTVRKGKAENSGDEVIPDIEVSDRDYLSNPLVADVKYWGHWVLEFARRRIARFYRTESAISVPIAYLWARSVQCSNPRCGSTVPLVRQWWLSKADGRRAAIRASFPKGNGDP